MHTLQVGKKIQVEDNIDTEKTPWKRHSPSISEELAKKKQDVSKPALPQKKCLKEWMEEKLEDFKKKLPIDDKAAAIMNSKPIRERIDLSFLPR